MQICESEDVIIFEGIVSSDHIHMHINYSSSKSINYMVKMLKGRSSRKLQQEFSELYKQYWGDISVQ